MKTRPAVLLFVLVLAAVARAEPAPLILVSLDGFRWDYCARLPAQTPHLRRLAAAGVTARGLIPVFPSNTFPNHYSIATGLYPAHHGIINNQIFDAARGAFFRYNQPAAVRDARWWGGEPIWSTAVKQGRPSAAALWPGSEAEIAGARPTYWKPYNYGIPFEQRLDELAGWLTKPPGQRPAVVAFYLEETNSAGHRHGPDSEELAQAVGLLDGCIGTLTQRLARAGIGANLVIVSDHGMTSCGPDRVVLFDDYIDLATVQIEFTGTVAGLRPLGKTDPAEVIRALRRMPHMQVYRAADLPARLHIEASSSRVPPIWILPDEGWQVDRRSVFRAVRDNFLKGQHGYDPGFKSMHGLFIASGPAFKSGVVIDAVESVHVYNLLCAALGLTPAPNDGDDRLVRSVMRE